MWGKRTNTVKRLMEERRRRRSIVKVRVKKKQTLYLFTM
jgi:hypothetical protein